jgi:translation initiation factor 1 (eIF-1/SUI1)
MIKKIGKTNDAVVFVHDNRYKIVIVDKSNRPIKGAIFSRRKDSEKETRKKMFNFVTTNTEEMKDQFTAVAMELRDKFQGMTAAVIDTRLMQGEAKEMLKDFLKELRGPNRELIVKDLGVEMVVKIQNLFTYSNRVKVAGKSMQITSRADLFQKIINQSPN